MDIGGLENVKRELQEVKLRVSISFVHSVFGSVWLIWFLVFRYQTRFGFGLGINIQVTRFIGNTVYT